MSDFVTTSILAATPDTTPVAEAKPAKTKKPTAKESLAKQKTADAAKKAAKKSAATKPAAKKEAPAKPEAKPVKVEGTSVHANEPTREPNWSDRRKAVVLAMRELGGTGITTALTAEAIADKAAKLGAPELATKNEKGVFYTKIMLDVYRTNELVHNGFVATCKVEGERALRYYLTPKGRTTKFPAAVKPAKEEATK